MCTISGVLGRKYTVNVRALFKVKTAPYTQMLRVRGLLAEYRFFKSLCIFMYYVEILRKVIFLSDGMLVDIYLYRIYIGEDKVVWVAAKSSVCLY